MFRFSTSQTRWVILSESGHLIHFIISNSIWSRGVMLGLISLSSVSLPPFLSTKQRSSYTYVQTDSIKYDSKRLRRFWGITLKTSVSYLRLSSQTKKKSLGANRGSIRLVTKAQTAVLVTSGIPICGYFACNKSTCYCSPRSIYSLGRSSQEAAHSFASQLVFLLGNNLKLEVLQHC